MKTRLKDGTVAYTGWVAASLLQKVRDGERGGGNRCPHCAERTGHSGGCRRKSELVVHTPSGAAQYVASVIDKQCRSKACWATSSPETTTVMVILHQ